MRLQLVLDEPREHDKQLEVRGLTFLIDSFTAMLVEEVVVGYDEYEDNFTVQNAAGPNSSCGC